jgi:hypothetical protein
MELIVNTEFNKAKKFVMPESKPEISFMIEPITAKENLRLAAGCSKTITNGKIVIKDGKRNAQETDSLVYYERLKDLLLIKIKGYAGIRDFQTKKELEFNRKNLEILLDSLWSKKLFPKMNGDGTIEVDEDGNEQWVVLHYWLYDCASTTENYCEGDSKN